MQSHIGILLVAAVAALISNAPAQDEMGSENGAVIQATEKDRLMEMDGQPVAVEGKVVRIGTTDTKSITFLDMTTEKTGFVAVVFQKSYPHFPDGFDHYKNQTVRVYGDLKIYRGETPQIALETPSQIKIVTATEE